jgi:hypothetical protein
MERIAKSAFAARIGVTPGRISQMIAAGQIGPEAIDGEGQRAKIIVDVALSHLKERMNVDQRMGLNGLSTQLQSTPTGGAPPAPPPQATLPASADDSVEAQIKAEKLEQNRLLTERMQRESRAQAGIYIRADAAKQEMGRIASSMMMEFESSLQPMADAVSSVFNVPRRDVVLTLRKSLREWQKQTSDRLARQAKAMPTQIEDLDDATDD